MKKIVLLIIVTSASLFALTQFSSTSKYKARKPKQAASDWFIDQRIYPYGYVNDDAYNMALTEARALNSMNKFQNTPLSTPWQFAGPTNIGGRISDLEMDPTNQNVIYLGAASGGVFKSTDQGNSFTPIFDQNASLSIGDIALAPSNPNIVWVGTGEPNNGRGSVTYDGQGVYKSTDAGITWTSMGLQNTKVTGRIAIHPTNPNIVFVATMGNLFGNGPNRGLYKTTDGGLTWNNVLFMNDSTGAVEVAFDPVNPSVMYATTWTRVRRIEYVNYAGSGSKVHKSTDGGNTWTVLTNGLPASSSNIGRIGLDISKSNPNTLYLIYSDGSGGFLGMYKTTNAGASWAPVTGNNFLLSNFTSSAMYWYGHVYIHPSDPNTIFATDLDLWKTTNGGGNWSDVSGNIHVDQHALYIHPQNPNLVICGNDGGFYKSIDGGLSWTNNQNIPITQFYTVTIDPQAPSNLYGGTQDNGTNMTPTGNLNDWQSVFGGDGFYAIVNSATNVFEYQYGNLSTGMTGVDFNENANWNSPLCEDPSNPNIIYYGRQTIYASSDGGYNWNSISPDLTAGIQQGNLVYHSMTTIGVSPANTNVIWAGCDDGNVHVTQNGGGSWTNVTAGLPTRWVTRLTPDPLVAGTAYVTLSGFRWNEYQPHILRTTNYGAAWTDISSNLPQAPCNDVIVDPNNTNRLFVATDVGVFYSDNLGGNWQMLGTGLPLVAVTDLALNNPTRTLVAATYGRSMYKMDLNIALGEENSPTEVQTSIFPNPCVDKVQFVFSKEAPNRCIKVYSIGGSLIAQSDLLKKENTLNTSLWANAAYIYQVIEGGKIISSGKLVKW
jgi:photosystem II stability/assembly factor-like uncharacterized protein